MILEDEKYRVATAMARFGGSFTKALGQALASADIINTLKIKKAFSEYWSEYLELYNSLEKR